jgi:hypothetical protein
VRRWHNIPSTLKREYAATGYENITVRGVDNSGLRGGGWVPASGLRVEGRRVRVEGCGLQMCRESEEECREKRRWLTIANIS